MEWITVRLLHIKSMDIFTQKAQALFNCHKCGFCCLNMPCELSEEEIPIYKKMTKPEDWEDATHLKVPCPFFKEKTKICTIYDQRPVICTTFPLNPLINEITQRETMRISAINHCKLAFDIFLQVKDFLQNKMKQHVTLDEKMFLNKDKDVSYNHGIELSFFETFYEWKRQSEAK